MVLDAMTLFAFMAHRDSVDIWQDGNPIDYWIDEYGFRCIRYESGRWWRYHLVGTTVLHGSGFGSNTMVYMPK